MNDGINNSKPTRAVYRRIRRGGVAFNVPQSEELEGGILGVGGERLGVQLPDCTRLRADGTNEVMGIQPDLLIGLRQADGPRRLRSNIEALVTET